MLSKRACLASVTPASGIGAPPAAAGGDARPVPTHTASSPRDVIGADYWVCHLDSPGEIRRDSNLRIDTDSFHRDQYRPGVPGASVPRK